MEKNKQVKKKTALHLMRYENNIEVRRNSDNCSEKVEREYASGSPTKKLNITTSLYIPKAFRNFIKVKMMRA